MSCSYRLTESALITLRQLPVDQQERILDRLEMWCASLDRTSYGHTYRLIERANAVTLVVEAVGFGGDLSVHTISVVPDPQGRRF